MSKKSLNVYLAGEIHSDWRERIIEGTKDKGLDVTFTSPVTDHESSDMCGVNILGEEEKQFWRDRKGAGLNEIRRKTMINESMTYVKNQAKWKAAREFCEDRKLEFKIMTEKELGIR